MRNLCLILSLILIAFAVDGYVQSQDIILPDDSVWGLSWSSDGTRIAVGRFNGNVEVWDSSSVEIVEIFQTGSRVVDVVWSPNGEYIAIASANGAVFIQRATDGQVIIRLQGVQQSMIHSLTWRLDSARIAGVNLDDQLLVWDVNSGDLLLLDEGHMTQADWFEDKVVSGIGTGVAIENIDTGNFITGLGTHLSMVTSVAWNPDGTRIASGSITGDIYVWDAVTYPDESYGGLPLLECYGHSLATISLSWYPDGRYLASASLDGTVRIWDTTTGEQIHVIDTGAYVLSVQWSPDGTRLAYAGDVEAMGAVIEIVDVASLILPDIEE